MLSCSRALEPERSRSEARNRSNHEDREVKLEIDPNARRGDNREIRRSHTLVITVDSNPKEFGDLRLVLDMRVPNTALVRRRVQIPTVNEILQKMEEAKVFTKADLSQGYLQLTLAEESRYITAFSTPEDGPHRFKRLIMGASPSGEHFHEIIHQLIKDIPDCENISHNIWLWSKDRATHLKQLEKLLTILESKGITLKLPKCSFAVPEINVFGHIVSEKGIRPDIAKVEVRSFLGLTNYCARYIPGYSAITFPLRQLTKNDVKFQWEHKHEKAFQFLKDAITTAPVLAHYSLTAETKVVVNASPWAIGAVLLQKQADEVIDRSHMEADHSPTSSKSMGILRRKR